MDLELDKSRLISEDFLPYSRKNFSSSEKWG
jgi:hypothetical protein